MKVLKFIEVKEKTTPKTYETSQHRNFGTALVQSITKLFF